MSANDIASAINNLCVELGDFLGPILGGFLTDKFGFSVCCFLVSMLGIFYAVIFIFFFFDKIKNDFNLVCQNKKPESGDDNEIDRNENDDYIPNFKMYFSMNKYKIRSYSFKNLERANNPRISLYTSITE